MPPSDEPMMNHSRELPTLAEFQAAIQQFRRFEFSQFKIVYGALFCDALIIIVVIWLFETSEAGRLSMLFSLVAILFCGLIWAMVQGSRYVKQNPLLLCRSCHKSIYQQSGIVIATGKCPNCGQQTIEIPDLPENDVPIPPRMTRQEYKDAVLQKSRLFDRSARLGLIGFLVIMFGGLGVYHALDGPNQPPPFQFLPALGFVVFVFPWLYWCRRRALRPQPQDELLKCPNCNAGLTSSLVSATGKCQECRRVVFRDSIESLSAQRENPLA